ncbi:unnamed protein product [Mucor circinelloides]|uniref:Uncharacterized protein n=1 Tax=Mucor circinelloides f. circinelloides (strain 1006PhL) TaxID=1220926 RepID=S2IY04_MUCC1|nr:hypothetical protein HMPREF1544_10621 [Mucor circinelloides 1006PhL]
MLKPKIRSRSSRSSFLGQNQTRQGRAHSQHGFLNVQTSISAHDSNALKTKIRSLTKLCHDLKVKMRLFKRKMLSNQLLIKNYAKITQADQDKLREEVGNILISLEDEMSLTNDSIETRLSNVENRVLALIEAKLKADRRKGWCGKSIRIS